MSPASAASPRNSAGLEALQQRYADKGFAVLGFPATSSAARSRARRHEIAAFCTDRFGVDFPMFGKVEVNGDGASPLWKALKKSAPGLLGSEAIKWNFTKFLIDRQGQPWSSASGRT